MKRFLLLHMIALVLLPTAAKAHPPVSVVMDSRGNVFYSDLTHVWRISRDGQKSIAVPNVHTHELYLDAGDNLYGEHLWYEGEATDKWGHRVWRRARDGRISVVIPTREGFPRGYSFVRDRTGAQYWAERGKTTEIHRLGTDGRTTVVSRGPFKSLGWMIAALDGSLYLVDSGDLKRVAPNGAVTTVARSVGARSRRQLNVGERHAVMGLWLDARGNIYAAVYGAAVVRRITPGGQMTTLLRSPLPWSPTGGMFAPNGDLWLLETTITNKVRVRRISQNGRSRVF